LLNTRLTSSELNYQIKNSEATLLITTEELCQEKKLETNKVKTFTEIKELKQNVDKPLDRKSTRLNSSHVSISYADFCLKKKIIRYAKVDELPPMNHFSVSPAIYLHAKHIRAIMLV